MSTVNHLFAPLLLFFSHWFSDSVKQLQRNTLLTVASPKSQCKTEPILLISCPGTWKQIVKLEVDYSPAVQSRAKTDPCTDPPTIENSLYKLATTISLLALKFSNKCVYLTLWPMLLNIQHFIYYSWFDYINKFRISRANEEKLKKAHSKITIKHKMKWLWKKFNSWN